MKRVFSVILGVMLIVGMTLSVSADPGAFLNSPSVNPAPEIVSYSVDSDECVAKLILTPYSERDTLSDAGKDEIKHAYDDIKSSTDLTDLTEQLEDLADEKGIPGTDLAVSDLFDLDFTDCDYVLHENGHGYFTIKLKADTLENFVGLIQMKDDEWKVIEGAVAEGDLLTFKTDKFSPFAIVVENSPAKPPLTGENGSMYLWGALMIISAVAMIVCIKKYNKKEA